MTALAEKIYNEVLDLPTEERLSLLDRLLHTSNIATDPAIDREWCAEAKKRDRQIEDGKAKLVPGHEVASKIEKRLGQ